MSEIEYKLIGLTTLLAILIATGFFRKFVFLVTVTLRLKLAVYALKSLDAYMQKRDFTRAKRRQFWREFTSDKDGRAELFALLEKKMKETA